MSAETETTNALILLGELAMPYIEFAEGQKALLVSRGWSAGPAEQYALVLLCGLARGALSQGNVACDTPMRKGQSRSPDGLSEYQGCN